MEKRARLRQLVRQSKALSNLANQAIGHYETLRDRNLTREARWERRSSNELGFWADSLRAGRFADLLDPHLEVQATCLRRAVGDIPVDTVSILDVGSGPLTAVGHTFPGKTLSVVATDALADEYNEILRACEVDPPVVPIACAGEELRTRFAERSFDVAYCQNALDHTVDPLTILSHMLALVKPNGRVALNHFRNEGERNSYVGLHFWNIDHQDGALVFWNRQGRHDVSALLAPQGWGTESWAETDEWGEHIHSLISPMV